MCKKKIVRDVLGRRTIRWDFSKSCGWKYIPRASKKRSHIHDKKKC